MGNSQGKPYGQRVKEAMREGARAGAALRKRRIAAGSKGHFGVYGQLPKLLHRQLTDRYGSECFADDGFMRDLKRLHPEMMNASGEDVTGENLAGTANRFGRVTWKRLSDGTWLHWTGRDWERKTPPSKMNWNRAEAPKIL